jgi:hypothetical protein
MLFLILFLLYLLSLCFYNNKISQFFIIILCNFILYKFITNNRKCILSYIECKLRKIKKEKSVIYNSLEEIYNINTTNYKYLLYLFIIFIMLLNLKKYTFN